MKIARLFIIALLIGCSQLHAQTTPRIIVGGERFDQYLPLLKDKKVALVVNQSSIVAYPPYERNLLDTLMHLSVKVVKIFSPEHGLRGTADAGEEVQNGKDVKTGLPVVSLYGNNKKPTPENMAGVDVVVFDMQDVGARFFTYISTMHYVMEACAAAKVPMIVLDRPNPNGFYVDGPVLQEKFKSFVGMDPVPIVHGMTIGEYAQMLNGEGWLEGKVKCNLTVVPCLNYDHEMHYKPRQKPSPNLPNITAIYLYPSLCLLEGTVMSLGRGTDFPFQAFGHPNFSRTSFTFTPETREGAKEPLYKGHVCYGIDLHSKDLSYFNKRRTLTLEWLIMSYKMLLRTQKGKPFFTDYFTKLAGTDQLQKQIEQNMTEAQIREAWQPDLEKFRVIRSKYLLYKDFNKPQP